MHEIPPPELDVKMRRAIGQSLGGIPQGLYIMSAAHEMRCRAVLVSFVQQAGFDPPTVVVALNKGRDIVPIIHDSHAFALSQIAEDDRLVIKKFAEKRGRTDDDPLAGLEIIKKVTGSPILCRAVGYLDCRLVRHIDVDSDHDLYVGQILCGGLLTKGKASVRLRANGLKY